MIASAPDATYTVLWSNGYKSVLTANVTRVNTYIYQFTFEKTPRRLKFYTRRGCKDRLHTQLPLLAYRQVGESNNYDYHLLSLAQKER